MSRQAILDATLKHPQFRLAIGMYTEGRASKIVFWDFVLTCGLMGVRSPKLSCENLFQC